LKIKLVEDTIDSSDLVKLSKWIETNPRLTKGDLTEQFESKWADWIGCKHAVFVNSGSSANLAIIYSLIISEKLKNKKIVFPCLSWVTTVSPAIQFGLTPILCDTDKETLGLDLMHLEVIFKEQNPSVLMLVHALGFPNQMNEIQGLCEKYDVLLIEDSCETVGSTYGGVKTGNFGFASSFSTYFGHHFSTIEGGFVCTNDTDFYNVIKSIRSHGWSRDLDVSTQIKLKSKHSIDDFRNLYTFYYPGFNLRSTDLQAFIGLGQIEKLNDICFARNKNYKLYDRLIKNSFWKIDDSNFEFVSNFAYPIIHPERDKIVNDLMDNKIECRPLIAGNMGKQPFFYERYGMKNYPFADVIHDYGLYVPNHQKLKSDEIEFVCSIINKHTR
tara:strand:+ start:2062 stop:3216 length:1155 start_codon:yes stop_codon:yes gene_type:complete